MGDFGTLRLNGKEIPMAAPPKVSFVGERTIGTGFFLRGKEIRATELTFRADRRAFVCFQLALSGGRPHRSHRVAKRRKARIDRNRRRDWRRRLDSHQRCWRQAQYALAKERARETRQPVETELPSSGARFVVEVR